LHGDPRGFRSRRHRIHSSGDYKNPPHPNEHVHLRTWMQVQLNGTVALPPRIRRVVACQIVRVRESMPVRALALSVAATHVHLLVGLPRLFDFDRKLVGACKTLSSRAIRVDLPGAVWSRGHTVVPIADRRHQLATFRYISQRQERSASLWTHLQGFQTRP